MVNFWGNCKTEQNKTNTQNFFFPVTGTTDSVLEMVMAALPCVWASFRNSFNLLLRSPNTLAASYTSPPWVSPFCPSGFSSRRVPTVPVKHSREESRKWVILTPAANADSTNKQLRRLWSRCRSLSWRHRMRRGNLKTVHRGEEEGDWEKLTHDSQLLGNQSSVHTQVERQVV